jgi:hypothetical protein
MWRVVGGCVEGVITVLDQEPGAGGSRKRLCDDRVANEVLLLLPQPNTSGAFGYPRYYSKLASNNANPSIITQSTLCPVSNGVEGQAQVK